MGSKVFVVEQRDRRVRIEQPISGWCSLRSSNGDTILTPLDDSDAVPTTTPLAGQIRDGQEAAQQNVNNKQSAVDNLNDQLQTAVQSMENNDVNEITTELDRLKEEVKNAAQVNHELMVAKQKVKQFGEEAAELEQRRSDNQAQIDALQAAIAEKQAELQQQLQGNEEVLTLQEQLEEAQAAREAAQEKVYEYDLIAEAAQIEVTELRREMQDMFFQEEAPQPAQSLQDGDVVMLDGDDGIVVIRFFGAVQFAEGDHIGVELSDPFGDCNGTVEGVEYFTCPEDCGKFYPVTHIKKKITGEELLMKLQAAVKMVTQENTTKE